MRPERIESLEAQYSRNRNRTLVLGVLFIIAATVGTYFSFHGADGGDVFIALAAIFSTAGVGICVSQVGRNHRRRVAQATNQEIAYALEEGKQVVQVAQPQQGEAKSGDEESEEEVEEKDFKNSVPIKGTPVIPEHPIPVVQTTEHAIPLNERKDNKSRNS